jgi:hypothetical protein
MEQKPTIKTDCFAYASRRNQNNGRKLETCMALNALYCRAGECKFYKTKERACYECKFTNCSGCAIHLADAL